MQSLFKEDFPLFILPTLEPLTFNYARVGLCEAMTISYKYASNFIIFIEASFKFHIAVRVWNR